MNETTSCSVLTLEEHRLALHHIVTHSLVHLNSVHRHVDAVNMGVLNRDTPLFAVLVHVVRKKSIIEHLHSFAADMEVITHDPAVGTKFGIHYLCGNLLAY